MKKVIIATVAIFTLALVSFQLVKRAVSKAPHHLETLYSFKQQACKRNVDLLCCNFKAHFDTFVYLSKQSRHHFSARDWC